MTGKKRYNKNVLMQKRVTYYPTALHTWALLWLLLPCQLLWSASTTFMVMPAQGDAQLTVPKAMVRVAQTYDRFIWIDPKETANYLGRHRGETQDFQDTLSQAEALLQEAKALFSKGSDGNINEAQSRFERARVLYRKSLFSDKAFQGMRYAKFYLAMIYLKRNEVGRAKQELIEVYVQDPDRDTRDIPAKQFSRELRRLYDDVKKDYQKLSNATLQVDVAPAGAHIFLNGRARGQDTLRVEGLPIGEHHLRVEKDGYTIFDETKYLSRGFNAFKARLVPLKEYVVPFFSVYPPGKHMSPRDMRFLDAMANDLGGEVFVFIRLTSQGVEAQLYDQRSHSLSEVFSGPDPATLLEALTLQLDERGYVLPRAEEVKTSTALSLRQNSELAQRMEKSRVTRSKKTAGGARKGKSGAVPLYKNKWVIIGGSAVLGAGLYFLLSGSSSQKGDLIWVVQ